MSDAIGHLLDDIEQLQDEVERLREERDRYREELEDLAEGWVGSARQKAARAIREAGER